MVIFFSFMGKKETKDSETKTSTANNTSGSTHSAGSAVVGNSQPTRSPSKASPPADLTVESNLSLRRTNSQQSGSMDWSEYHTPQSPCDGARDPSNPQYHYIHGQTPLGWLDFITALQGTTTKQARAIDELRGQLDGVWKEHHQLDQLLRGSDGQALALMDSTLPEQVAELQDKLDRKCEELRVAHDTLRLKDDELKEVASLRADKSANEDRIATVQREMTKRYEDSQSAHERRILALQAESEKKIKESQEVNEQRMAALQGDLEKKDGELNAAHSTLEDSHDRFKNEEARLRAEITTLREALVKEWKDLRIAHDTIKDRDSELQAAYDAQKVGANKLKEVANLQTGHETQIVALREELEKKREELRMAYDALKDRDDELKDRDDKLKDRDDELKDVKATNSAHKKRIGVLEVEVEEQKEWQSVYDALEDGHDTLKKEMGHLRVKNAVLEKQIPTLKEELANKSQELQGDRDNELRNVKAAYEERIAALKGKLTEKRKEWEAAYDALESRNNKVGEEVARLQAANTALSREIMTSLEEEDKESRALHAALEDKNNRFNDLQAAKSALEKQNMTLRGDLAEEGKRLQATYDMLKDRDSEFNHLRAINSGLEKQITALQELAEKNESQASRIALDNRDNIAKEMNHLRTANSRLERDIITLRGKLEESRASESAARNALGGKDSKFNGLQAANSKLEEQIATLKGKLADKDKESKAVYAMLEGKDDEYNDLQVVNFELEEQIATLLEEKDKESQAVRVALEKKASRLTEPGFSLQVVNSQLEQQIVMLQEESAEKDRKLQAVHDASKNRVDKLQATNSALEEQIATLQAKLVDKEESQPAHDALEDRDSIFNHLGAVNRMLENQITRLRESLGLVEKQKESQDARVVSGDRDSRLKEIGRLRAVNLALEEEITTSQRNLKPAEEHKKTRASLRAGLEDGLNEMARPKAANSLLEEQIATLRRQLEEKDEESQAVHAALEDKLNHLQGVNSALQKQITTLQGNLKSAEKHSEAVQDVSEGRNKKLEGGVKIGQLKAQLDRLQKERDGLDQLLKDRTAELLSAQAFLRTADSVSVTEVSRKMEALNEKVFQLSATVADRLTELPKDYQVNQADVDKALSHVKPLIGQLLKDTLAEKAKRSFRPSQTLSEIVLRTALMNACACVIKEWNPAKWGSCSNMENVYTAMRSSEGQAIAGRWRALTHAYIAGQSRDDIRTETSKFLQEIWRRLLISIGWSAHIPIPSRYEERIDDIAAEVIKIRDVIGKDVTSVDLQAHAIQSEEHFDPDHMNDLYPGGGPVLCTVALGLWQSGNPSSTNAEQRKSKAVLKPEIIRVSALEAGDI